MVARALGPIENFARSSVTRVVEVDSDGVEHAIAIVRIEDTLYALGDRCSHADVSLSEGSLWPDDCQLECPKHGSAFSLLTGEPASFPATKPVPVYLVECVDGNVVLVLN